jgi:hypothetical protein
LAVADEEGVGVGARPTKEGDLWMLTRQDDER